MRRDDADQFRDVVVELLVNRQQPGAVVRARDDPVAAQLATEDLDLGFQKTDAGVPTGGARFKGDARVVCAPETAPITSTCSSES